MIKSSVFKRRILISRLKKIMMKKILLILFLFLSSNLFAQNFAPAGAKWYYSHSDGISPYEFYSSVESVLDTSINGMSCSKLNAI